MNKYSYFYGPMPEELLHSFIFRVLRRNGYFKECSSVVSKTGWNSRPIVPQHCSWLFNNKSQPNLAAFFYKSLGEKYAGNIFDSPLLLLRNLKQLFLNNSKKYPSYGYSIEVRYCKRCFEEQINEFGFTYFKQYWLSEDVCKQHQTSLSTFQFNQKVSSTAFVSSPMSVLAKERTNDKSLSEYVSFPNLDFCDKSEKIKFALCAKRKMTNILLNFLHTFRYDFFNKNGEDMYRLVTSSDFFYLTSGKLEAEYDIVLLEYLNKITKKSPEIYEKYILPYLKQVTFKYEDKEIGEFSSQLMKDRDQNCASCKRCFEVAKKFNPSSITNIL